MACLAKDKEWESLTFYGLQNCNLPENLESTRHGFLVAAQNQYGEKLIDFAGSIYRGFDLMLHNHILPVIIMNKVTSNFGEVGLVVTDLRSAPMSVSLIQQLHDNVRNQVDNKLSMNILDASIDNNAFQTLFKDYLSSQSVQ